MLCCPIGCGGRCAKALCASIRARLLAEQGSKGVQGWSGGLPGLLFLYGEQHYPQVSVRSEIALGCVRNFFQSQCLQPFIKSSNFRERFASLNRGLDLTEPESVAPAAAPPERCSRAP